MGRVRTKPTNRNSFKIGTRIGDYLYISTKGVIDAQTLRLEMLFLAAPKFQYVEQLENEQ